MITKRKDAVLRELAIYATLAALFILALLSGCAESEPAQQSDIPVSFSVAPTDRPASGNGSLDEGNDAVLTKSEEADDPDLAVLRAEIDALVEPYGNSVAVGLTSLDGLVGFDINGDEGFVSASMIKLLVLACLMDKVSDGSLSLEQSYELSDSDMVGGTGHINALPPGTVLRYDELAELMIAYSDNTATNVLIDAIGMDAINDTAKAYGLSSTSLQRKMMDFSGSTENYMSVNDAMKLLAAFANGEIGDVALSERAVFYLKAQEDNTALAQGIPEGVSFAHKTGSLNGIRHDGGIVYADKPYVLVVFTSGISMPDSLMASISSIAYEALKT